MSLSLVGGNLQRVMEMCNKGNGHLIRLTKKVLIQHCLRLGGEPKGTLPTPSIEVPAHKSILFVPIYRNVKSRKTGARAGSVG